MFQPLHPLARYCCAACRQAARRWSRWRAAREYRNTDAGRQRRREQCRRYRERVKQRQAETTETPREGHHQDDGEKKFSCARPGCYVRFRIHPRSPCQRFCGALCRQALRRVLVREARWRREQQPRAVAEPVACPRGP